MEAGTRNFHFGNRFEADHIFGPVFLRDEYRIRSQGFAAHHVIVDIGAHIGTFSYLCHLQGSRAIHSYEPAERNFAMLEQNLGRLPGVRLFPKAVWRSDGVPPNRLLLSGAVGDNTGSHSVLAAGHAVDFANQRVTATLATARSVEAVPLDDILRTFDQVKLLKLDCEGSEFPILLTSRELHRVERIVGEVHEQSGELMRVLDPLGRVPGIAEYRLETLVRRLESLGFLVDTRIGAHHLHLLNARRG